MQVDLLNHADFLAFNMESFENFSKSSATKIVSNIELVEASISDPQHNCEKIGSIDRNSKQIQNGVTDQALSPSSLYLVMLLN